MEKIENTFSDMKFGCRSQSTLVFLLLLSLSFVSCYRRKYMSSFEMYNRRDLMEEIGPSDEKHDKVKHMLGSKVCVCVDNNFCRH